MLRLVSLSVFLLIWSSGCESEFIELDHELNYNTQYWPSEGAVPFTLTELYRGLWNDVWIATNKFCSSEHLGTHLDAPFHLFENGSTMEKIPLENLFAPGVVIDVREKVKKNSIYALSAADVVQWVETHGPLPNNSLVMVLTGWSERYNNKTAYFGHASNSAQFIFPGVSASAVQTILGYKEASGIHIVGMGIDTPSLDKSTSKNLEAHSALLGAGGYIIEHMTNLEKLPPTGAEITVMPMKITKGTGAPARVVARLGSSIYSGSITNRPAFVLLFVALVICALSNKMW